MPVWRTVASQLFFKKMLFYRGFEIKIENSPNLKAEL